MVAASPSRTRESSDFDKPRIEALRRRCGKKWNTYDADVLPAWLADMDFEIAPPIRRRLQELLDTSEIGYPVDAHAGRLAQLLSRRFAGRLGWKVDPDTVEVIVDVIQGLQMGIELFTRPGQGVLILTPIYAPFLQGTATMGRRIDHCALSALDGYYRIDWPALESAIRDDTRLLLLCNPHNPLGRVFSRDELEKLAELVLKYDLQVVADEIHCDLLLEDLTHIPFSTISPEIQARTVTLLSASKAFNIAGLRCAFMVFGSPEHHEAYLGGPRFTRGALSSLGMHATEAAWTEGDEWLRDLVRYLRNNRARIDDFVRDHLPGVGHLPPQATYLAWLDCRALGYGTGLWQHIHDRGRLALSDGREFGPGGEQCVRLNFATSRQILDDALERLRLAIG